MSLSMRSKECNEEGRAPTSVKNLANEAQRAQTFMPRPPYAAKRLFLGLLQRCFMLFQIRYSEVRAIPCFVALASLLQPHDAVSPFLSDASRTSFTTSHLQRQSQRRCSQRYPSRLYQALAAGASTMRFPKRVPIMLASLAVLGACVHTIPSRDAEPSFCEVARPQQWSADLPDWVIRQIKDHNARGVELCGWGAE